MTDEILSWACRVAATGSRVRLCSPCYVLNADRLAYADNFAVIEEPFSRKKSSITLYIIYEIPLIIIINSNLLTNG